MASPDEAEMPEIKIEIDIAEDPGLQWTLQDHTSGILCEKTEKNSSSTVIAGVTNPWNPSAAIKPEAHRPTDSGHAITAEPVDHCVTSERFHQFTSLDNREKKEDSGHAITAEPVDHCVTSERFHHFTSLDNREKKEDSGHAITAEPVDQCVTSERFHHFTSLDNREKKEDSGHAIKAEPVDHCVTSERFHHFTSLDNREAEKDDHSRSCTRVDSEEEKVNIKHEVINTCVDSQVEKVDIKQETVDRTSGSLPSPYACHFCQHCPAAFVLVSSWELHLASVHGEKLHMVLPGSSTTPDRCDAGTLCDETNVSAAITSSVTNPGNPSAAVKSEAHSPTDSGQGVTAGPEEYLLMSGHQFTSLDNRETEKDNQSRSCTCVDSEEEKVNFKQETFGRTSGSLPSSYACHACQRCSVAFVLVSSLELHLASVHGEEEHSLLAIPGSSTPDRRDAGTANNTDLDEGIGGCCRRKKIARKKVMERVRRSKRKGTTNQKLSEARRRSSRIRRTKAEVNGVDRHNNRNRAMRKKVDDLDQQNRTRTSPEKKVDGSNNNIKTGMDKEADKPSKRTTKTKNKVKEVVGLTLRKRTTRKKVDKSNAAKLDMGKVVARQSKRKTCTKKQVCYKDAGNTGRKRTRQHVCDICSKSVSTATVLKNHRMIHAGVKPFACEICKKRFTEASNLKKHMRIHSGEKPFVCDMCGKSFAQSVKLNEHKAVHSDKRPYKCPQCDSRFKLLRYLQKHVRAVHEDARPHVCDICRTAFQKSDVLATHRRIHTGEKPYLCSHCGRAFTQSSTLRTHRLTHTGQKPNPCPLCPMVFKWPNDLKKHLQRKHH